jgi:hypothetical protein
MGSHSDQIGQNGIILTDKMMFYENILTIVLLFIHIILTLFSHIVILRYYT